MANPDLTDDLLIKLETRITGLKRKNRRVYFNVRDEDLPEVARYLFNDLSCRLSTATAAETYEGIEVLYHFSHDPSGTYYCPRVIIKDKTNPVMNSVSPVIKGAEWIEREMMELWGIKFEGHPRPEPLLTGNNPNARKVSLRFGRVI